MRQKEDTMPKGHSSLTFHKKSCNKVEKDADTDKIAHDEERVYNFGAGAS